VPGLSFICDFDRDLDPLLPSMRRALDAVCHDATSTSAAVLSHADGLSRNSER